SAWPVANFYVDYAKSLQTRHPEAASLLKNFRLNSEIVSGLSYSMVVEKKSADVVALEWVKSHSKLVESWLGQ
ncbi:glycine betaine ABC transporter substrate-binding protein, partial [Marinomonas arenicola]|uniref:glycine betaine ABC transporter substrate-binding protein n=1 Tax=Marinomonas arenicola TaxID=569601 RepID=UPI00311EC8DB